MKVFLSSTFRDLIDYRKIALEAIAAAGCSPIAWEFWATSSSSPQEDIRRAIYSSAVHLTILGTRYGAPIPDDTILWTEYEMREASNLGKPSFVYIVDFSGETVTQQAEAFRARVMESKIVKFVRTTSELRDAIIRELPAKPSQT